MLMGLTPAPVLYSSGKGHSYFYLASCSLLCLLDAFDGGQSAPIKRGTLLVYLNRIGLCYLNINLVINVTLLTVHLLSSLSYRTLQGPLTTILTRDDVMASVALILV